MWDSQQDCNGKGRLSFVGGGHAYTLMGEYVWEIVKTSDSMRTRGLEQLGRVLRTPTRAWKSCRLTSSSMDNHVSSRPIASSSRAFIGGDSEPWACFSTTANENPGSQPHRHTRGWDRNFTALQPRVPHRYCRSDCC